MAPEPRRIQMSLNSQRRWLFHNKGTIRAKSSQSVALRRGTNWDSTVAQVPWFCSVHFVCLNLWVCSKVTMIHDCFYVPSSSSTSPSSPSLCSERFHMQIRHSASRGPAGSTCPVLSTPFCRFAVGVDSGDDWSPAGWGG